MSAHSPSVRGIPRDAIDQGRGLAPIAWLVSCACRWTASAPSEAAAEREGELHLRSIERRDKVARRSNTSR